MLKPTPNQTLYEAAITFEWEARELAHSYHLEISSDWEFSEVLHRADVTGTRYQWQAPHKGVYYYRIYSIDHDEFAGPYSEPLGFYIDLDTEPPYLSVKVPSDGDVVLSSDIEVRGAVEQSAALTINDIGVDSDENGTFAHAVTLTPGEHVLTIAATDVAGNTTTIQRRIIYNTTVELLTLDTPSEMVVNTQQVSIRGTLRPGTRVEINGQPIELPEQFEHVLTLPEGRHAVTMTGISPEGDEQTLTLQITVDVTPPELVVKKVPRSTRNPDLTITGTVSEPVTLGIDGTALAEYEQEFSLPLALREGKNSFVLEAVDPAGNAVATTLRTTLDTTPPVITNVTFAPSETQGGDVVSCEISADDAGVGPAKTGSITFVITPGQQMVNGILTFNRGKGVFEGSAFIPADVAGTVAIHAISIQDRLKNEATDF